jgi:hypothetical protein
MRRLLPAFFLLPWVMLAILIATVPSQALFDQQAPGLVTVTAEYPFKSIANTISATGTTTAFSATLPVGTAFQTVYICGFEIDAAATAATAVPATVTGTSGGTLNFLEYVNAIASPGVGHTVTFTPCIPASAANTPIVINAGAAGTAGIASISAWGYLL